MRPHVRSNTNGGYFGLPESGWTDDETKRCLVKHKQGVTWYFFNSPWCCTLNAMDGSIASETMEEIRSLVAAGEHIKAIKLYREASRYNLIALICSPAATRLLISSMVSDAIEPSMALSVQHHGELKKYQVTPCLCFTKHLLVSSSVQPDSGSPK